MKEVFIECRKKNYKNAIKLLQHYIIITFLCERIIIIGFDGPYMTLSEK